MIKLTVCTLVSVGVGRVLKTGVVVFFNLLLQFTFFFLFSIEGCKKIDESNRVGGREELGLKKDRERGEGA